MLLRTIFSKLGACQRFGLTILLGKSNDWFGNNAQKAGQTVRFALTLKTNLANCKEF
jgi:hypothetical protein